MKRTLTQNSAMHKYFEMVASELCEMGLTVEKVLTKPLEIPWTPELVKELMWRRVQEAMFGKKSTTELTTKEVNEVYEVVARFLADKQGIVIEFPERIDADKHDK